MKIAFFGSSLISSYWNGAATYYRGIIRALSERGHQITFYEPDAWQRQQHRDIPDPEWARVVVYPAEVESVLKVVESAHDSDFIVKASSVGAFDELLEAAVLEQKTAGNSVAFWDVDAPATLERVLQNPTDRFAALIPRYDAIFTYGGGAPVVNAYRRLGAKNCNPIYNAVDPRSHHPVKPESRFECDLAFLGNRLPDRERRVSEFFFNPASACVEATFLLGGAGWGDRNGTENVRYLDHVRTAEHNAFNASPRLVLNVTRDSMARYGFSPATRVFEATGAGACLVTDAWEGIEQFFEPGREILIATDGDAVKEMIRSVSRSEARSIGQQALRRVVAENTYAHRAAQLDQLLGNPALELVGVLQ